MVLTRAAVEKMPKEELVNMVLNYDKTMESTLADLNKEISKINKNFEKLESELSISKTVNNALHKRVIQLEKQCWRNEQYSCRECIEVVGLPDSTTDNEVCSVFKKSQLTKPPWKKCLKQNCISRKLIKFFKYIHQFLNI